MTVRIACKQLHLAKNLVLSRDAHLAKCSKKFIRGGKSGSDASRYNLHRWSKKSARKSFFFPTFTVASRAMVSENPFHYEALPAGHSVRLVGCVECYAASGCRQVRIERDHRWRYAAAGGLPRVGKLILSRILAVSNWKVVSKFYLSSRFPHEDYHNIFSLYPAVIPVQLQLSHWFKQMLQVTVYSKPHVELLQGKIQNILLIAAGTIDYMRILFEII